MGNTSPAIVVVAGLLRTLGRVDSIESSLWVGSDRTALRKCGNASCLVLQRDDGHMKGHMLKRNDLEALVIVYGAVADELHLRHTRDRLENRRLGRLNPVVSISMSRSRRQCLFMFR
jgi:hypothetical protein